VKFVELGGREGDLSTNVGAPAELLPSATRFVSDYAAAGYPEPFAAYGVLTYDATTVLISGLATALAGGDYTTEKRPDIVQAVQATDVQGASGPISFDEFGDTTNKVLTVYSVANGAFAPVTGSTTSFEG
jgi:branched-chain amino acid transport system substrate-binding protein